MKLKKATIEELKSLKPGTVVVTDMDEHISDFAIFKFYDETTNTAVVVDCVTKMGSNNEYLKNIVEYRDICLIDLEEVIKEEVMN